MGDGLSCLEGHFCSGSHLDGEPLESPHFFNGKRLLCGVLCRERCEKVDNLFSVCIANRSMGPETDGMKMYVKRQ